MMVAAIGAAADIAGYGLAGALLCPAETGPEARTAWEALAAEVGLVILTNSAAVALFGEAPQDSPPELPGGRLVAVMPP
jgi:hypothetical protein